MRELTMEDKKLIITTNHWVSEYNFKLGEENNLAYGDQGGWKMLDVWLSQILGFDFRKDLYQDKGIFELSKIESVKKQFREKFDRGWFIGDAMHDTLFKLCHHNIQSEEEILKTEDLIREMYEFFQNIVPTFNSKTPPAEKEKFIASGVIVDGEMLYKRIST
jgi:hypothetical protein